MLKYLIVGAIAAVTIGTAPANAVTVTVTNGTTWGTIPGENGNGGSSTITSTEPRSGTGSIEMFGDRTRYSNGNYYDPASNKGLLSTVLGLAFDWRVAANSSGGYSPDQTPALRLHIMDGTQRSELVWEGAYNGTYGNTARDTWYSTSYNDLFYQYVAKAGVTLQNGSQVNQTVQAWESSYSANAYVTAISVGVGSGFSPNYHAFADNIRFDTVSGETIYNFEIAQAVPEPSTWAMMFLGFVGIGFITYRQRRTVTSAI